MAKLRIVLSAAAVLFSVFLFQNCAEDTDWGQEVAASATVPAPIINGQPMVIGPCAGSPAPKIINREYPSGQPLVFDDPGVAWASVKMLATASSTTGVWAQRLTLYNLTKNLTAFFPGSSFSPNNPVNYMGSSAVSLVEPGQHSLTVTLQDVQSVNNQFIIGGYYPLCGSTKVIAASKTELTSALPAQLDLTLTERADVFISGEKTVINVGNNLALSFSIVNVDTGAAIACPATGSTAWVYNSPSTPSVSGYCKVNLPPGKYRIRNVIVSDQANLAGTQHLGFLAVRATAGEDQIQANF